MLWRDDPGEPSLGCTAQSACCHLTGSISGTESLARRFNVKVSKGAIFKTLKGLEKKTLFYVFQIQNGLNR